MGRPQKKGLDSFSLPVDFFSQDIICALRSEFGLKGEISLVKILCTTFRCGYYLKWNAAVRLHLLGELPGVNAELLGQIVQRLLKWGYFDRDLFRQHHILTNVHIQEEYFSLTRRRRQCDRLPYLLVCADINGVIVDINGVSAHNNGVYVYKNPISVDINRNSGENPTDDIGISADINGVIADINGVSVDINGVSVDINPQQGENPPLPPITPLTLKEKKITPLGVIKKKKGENGNGEKGGQRRKEKSCAKKEKTAQNPPTLRQVEEYCRQTGSCVDAKRFLSNYSAVGWVTGNGIPITDWKAKLDEWTINERTKNDNGKKKTSGAAGAVAAADPQAEGAEGVSRWTGSDI